jgi:hypothetical protein
MTRRRIGTLALGLLGAATLAITAYGSDPVQKGSDSGMAVEGTAEGAAALPAPASAPPAAEAQAASVPAQAAPTPRGSVARATFTSAVVDREPQDSLESLGNDHREVAFFSELRGLEGQTVTHRWEHAGEVAAEVPIEVGGQRWRAYSTKRLDPSETGEWTVSVVDASGRVLETDSFEYRRAAPASGQAATPETAETAEIAPEAPPAAPQP